MSEISEDFLKLVAERDRLEQKLETITPINRELIHEVFLAAEDAVQRLLKDPVLCTELAEEYSAQQTITQQEKALAELDDLGGAIEFKFIDSGIIERQKEVINTKVEAIKNRPLYNLSVRYAGELGLKSTVDKPTSNTEADSTEVSNEPSEQENIEDALIVEGVIHSTISTFPEILDYKVRLNIVISANEILIKNTGKITKINKVSDKYVTEVNDMVIKLIKELAETDGENISSKKLWEKAFPGTELERNILKRLREVIIDIKYKRYQIFRHNENRGNSSAYYVDPRVKADVSFDKDYEISYGKDNELYDGKSLNERTSKLGLEDSKKSISPDTENEISVDINQLEPGTFPLDPVESELLAVFVQLNQDIIKSVYNLESLDQEIIDQLAEICEQCTLEDSLAKVSNIIGKSATISDLRKYVIDKTKYFFEDEENVLKAIDNMPFGDPRWKLFEYLAEVQASSGWDALSLLLDSKRALTGTMFRGTMLDDPQVAVQLYDGTTHYVGNDPRINSVTLGPIVDEEIPVVPLDYIPFSTLSVTEEFADDSQSNDDEVVELDVDDLALDLEIDNTIQIDSLSSSNEIREVEIGDAKNLSENLLVYEETLRQLAIKILKIYDKNNLGNKHMNTILDSLIRNGIKVSRQVPVYKSAMGRGILSELAPRSAKEIILFVIDQNPVLGKAMGIKSSVNKPDARVIERVTKEVIDSYYK